MEHIIKVLVRFDFLQSFLFLRSGSPPTPEFNVGTLVPEKETPASPSIFEVSVKKHNEKLTLLRLMESISKVDLYGKNSIVDSTVPPTP